MRIVGLDVSLSRTGFAIISDAGVVQFGGVCPPRGSDLSRQCSAVISVMAMTTPDDVIVMEDFGISSRFAPSGKFVERIELVGMLKLALYNKTKKPIIQCRPNHLKMFVTGKASAQKSEVVRSIRTVWGLAVSNDDEADAAGLAFVGRALVYGAEFAGRHMPDTTLQKILSWKDNAAAVSRARFFLPKVVRAGV